MTFLKVVQILTIQTKAHEEGLFRLDAPFPLSLWALWLYGLGYVQPPLQTLTEVSIRTNWGKKSKLQKHDT